MFKNRSQSKPVGRWSSWSSDGPLKVALSRLPSGAFIYPLELYSTLGCFRIPSAALCGGSCEGCHKESIVTKYNSKIWFYIYSKSLRIIIDLKINTNSRGTPQGTRKLQRAGETRRPSEVPRTTKTTNGRHVLIGYCF